MIRKCRQLVLRAIATWRAGDAGEVWKQEPQAETGVRALEAHPNLWLNYN